MEVKKCGYEEGAGRCWGDPACNVEQTRTTTSFGSMSRNNHSVHWKCRFFPHFNLQGLHWKQSVLGIPQHTWYLNHPFARDGENNRVDRGRTYVLIAIDLHLDWMLIQLICHSSVMICACHYLQVSPSHQQGPSLPDSAVRHSLYTPRPTEFQCLSSNFSSAK